MDKITKISGDLSDDFTESPHLGLNKLMIIDIMERTKMSA